MIRESRQARALIDAIARGYTIDKGGVIHNPKGKPLKCSVMSTGYLESSYRFDGRSVRLSPHQLQAYTKFGDKVFSVECVRHMNGVKTDNSWDNIEIGSCSDNMMDMPLQQRKERVRKSCRNMGAERLRARALLIAQNKIKNGTNYGKGIRLDYNAIVSFYINCNSVIETARRFKCAKTTVYAILKKKNYVPHIS